MALRLAFVLLNVCDAVTDAADHHGEAKHEQQVADDRAGDGGLDQFEQAGAHRGDGDDQLGGVAERGVEQRADARTGMRSQVFGGLPM